MLAIAPDVTDMLVAVESGAVAGTAAVAGIAAAADTAAVDTVVFPYPYLHFGRRKYPG